MKRITKLKGSNVFKRNSQGKQTVTPTTSELTINTFEPSEPKRTFPKIWHRERVKTVLVHTNGYDYSPTKQIKKCELGDPEANLVTSQIAEANAHAPVLDFDFPCQLVPSATPDHFHLYIDKPMSWSDYKKLLKVMEEVGLIEEGWYKDAIRNGFSMVRVPGVLKYEVERAAGSLQDLIEQLDGRVNN